jgi:soluble lytic murein transglycosylase-like protein
VRAREPLRSGPASGPRGASFAGERGPVSGLRRPCFAGEGGQAGMVLLGLLVAVVLGAVVLGGIARGVGVRGELQSAADLSALAAARAMHDAYPRVFEPSALGGVANPRHLERSEYLALGERAARATAARNGAHDVSVAFPGGGLAPIRVRVTVHDAIAVGDRQAIPNAATAEAELAPPGTDPGSGALNAGEYRGPFAYRQGKPMRPDVALAFDRMAKAARADGVELLITTAFRTDAEQARLFAAHPDPKWVAPPGRSLHRLATELDLGPPAAYAWLASNAERFHFTKRYDWEPWHFGFTLNAGSASLGYRNRSDGESSGTLPSFVPARFAPAIARAAQRWSVSGALLAAQLYAESHFNPFARSPAGAQGIAQFMPATAARYGLADPFDSERAIDAQAHLMRDLLRAFASVPLALAAYNAGPTRVRACGCVPPIPETQSYVADILGLLHGAGDPSGDGAGALEIRLVR